jgi:serine beta-lactamase-like protein LACTB, mitochondrial
LLLLVTETYSFAQANGRSVIMSGLRAVLVGVLVPVSSPSLAEAPRCIASDRQLIEAIRAVHDKQHNVGVQTAIRLDGWIVFSTGLGLADRERKIPVTRQTRFPLASLTKAYTGVATLKAVASGKLDLDAPIQKYVPEFPVKPELTITSRRLAAHRAGIHHWGPERHALYARHFTRLADIVALFKDDPLLPNAGKDYQYSSYGYNLLALAVERATGIEFTQYVSQEVLGPLGLSKTHFDDVRHRFPNTTSLYSIYDPMTYAEVKGQPRKVPSLDYSHNLAAGNMSSTAEDVTKFGSALLGPGFLPSRQYNLLFVQPTFGGEPSAMSFGFFAPKAGAERRITISGANPGVQTGLAVYPDRGLAVAVLANTWGIDSRSGEMGVDLPRRLADLCRPTPSSPKPQ